MKKYGDSWGLNFDLKYRRIPGLSLRKGLRFEKGGDLLRDRQDNGLDGGYLVKRGWENDTWEPAGAVDNGARFHELRGHFGVWRTNTFKQLLNDEVDPEDVTPLSEVFDTPNLVEGTSSAGGLISHELYGTVDDAALV